MYLLRMREESTTDKKDKIHVLLCLASPTKMFIIITNPVPSTGSSTY